MASKIEHAIKRDAYMNCMCWSEGMPECKDATFYSREKYNSHVKYMEDMKKSKKYWYGTPPRSKFLNWLGHKFLKLAWGELGVGADIDEI